MKIRDSLYHYPGHVGRPATAHLRVYRHESSTVAIVGELADNPSTTIINAAGVVCRQLRDEYGPDVIVIDYHPGSKHLVNGDLTGRTGAGMGTAQL